MACVAARPAVIVFGVMVARWKVLGWVEWCDTSLRLFNCLINVCLTVLPIVYPPTPKVIVADSLLLTLLIYP
jgi:hypothetical protein